MQLLERSDQLMALGELLRVASYGEGSFVVVDGEAGVGKTALMQHFASQADPNTRVLWGSCDRLLTPRPLGPLHDVAQQAGGRVLAAMTSSADRAVLFATLLDELHRPRVTNVFVVEDAHWADEATIELLRFLGRRIARTRALIVVTYRSDEVGPDHPLQVMFGDVPAAVVRRISPRPLSLEAVSHLAACAGRASAAARLHAITGGNAFFVTEALAAHVIDGDIPASVRDAVLARVAGLSPAARAVIDLTSVSPTGIEWWLLDRVLAPLPGAIDECRRIGMARDADGRLEFRHELARRAIEEALSPERRRALHAACLTALGDLAPWTSTARLVHHADHAGDVDTLLRLAPLAAAEAASYGAHRDAAYILGRVLRHAKRLPAEAHAKLLERHAYECYLTNRIEDARRSYGEALAMHRRSRDRLREGNTLRWLSRMSWFVGASAVAERYAGEAVNVLESLPDSRELGMAYSNVAQLGMLSDDAERAAAWGARAIAIGKSLGDAELLAHALNNVGTAEYLTSGGTRHDTLDESLAISLASGLHEHAARAYANLTSNSVMLRQYADAARFLEDGLAYCEANDLDSWRQYQLAFRAHLRFETGDWSGAAADAAAVLDDGRAAAVSRIPALVVAGRLQLHRGDARWRATLDEARDLAALSNEPNRVGPVACARAEAAWLHGNLDATIDEATVGYDLAITRSRTWSTPDLALWLYRGGRRISSAAALPDAVARQIAGDWRGAAYAWEALGCSLERALTLTDADDEEALRDALAMLDALGAVPAAALVRRRLRYRGVRRIPRGVRASTRQNPRGLTTRELEILSLIAEGLRDADIAARLFLSVKTVGHHVSAVLAKLRVRSRVEAAAAARTFDARPTT